jgi:hypothetical protein
MSTAASSSFHFRFGSFSDELCSPRILAFDVQQSTPKAKILVRPCSSKKPLISEMETNSFYKFILFNLIRTEAAVKRGSIFIHSFKVFETGFP